MEPNDEIEAEAARVFRKRLAELRSAVLDGTGLTLAEFLEAPEEAVWRDADAREAAFRRFVEGGD